MMKASFRNGCFCLAVALMVGGGAFTRPAIGNGPATYGLKLESSSLRGGGQPFAIIAADLNGDGKTDLAVTNPKVSTISIRRGKGDGTFEKPAFLQTGPRPRGIVAGDFNNDGKPDLAVATTGQNSVTVHLGLGGGRFGPGESFAVRARPFMLQAADLDRDGDLDLVVSNEGETAEGKALSVLLGDGSGRFSVTSLSTGKHGSDVAVADFDRDGNVDVAVSTWGTNDVNLHFGRGDGTLSAPRSFSYEGHGLYRVLAADLDSDGNPDMVWNDLERNGLYVLYGDGKGGFPRSRLLQAAPGVRHAAASDLDGNGWLDLVSTNTGAGNITIHLADGEGGYGPPQQVPAGVFPRMVAIADLNGDERPDLVVTNMRSNDLTLLLNEGRTVLPQKVEEPVDATPKLTAPLDLPTFRLPNGIAVDPAGKHVFVSDQQNHRIARVEIASGKITTVAGTGEAGYSGDGGPAFAAQVSLPGAVDVDDAGNVYIVDFGNNRIRRVDPSGVITTVAGTGKMGYSGDGGPADKADLNHPFGVVVDRDGSIYVADAGNNRIRKIGPSGIIRTVAGNGRSGYSGDGGPATEARIGVVTALALDPAGNLILADQFNFRIRKLSRDGILTTIAGDGMQGPGGDGGPATKAQLTYPSGVAADAAGNVYIADQDGNLIRRVSPSGVIEAVAGTGKKGYAGDGGPATEALIWFPSDVAADGRGNIFFTDRYNGCIRKVDPSGIITTVAGK